MKYYYINLENALDRRTQIELQFQQNDISFNRVEAFLYNNNNNHIKTIKGNKENACIRSHIKAIFEFIMNSNDEYAIICEDDLTFELKKYWRCTPDEVVKNAPVDYGIIQLAIIFARINKSKDIWNNLNTYFKWGGVRDVGSCLAYVINRKCAIEVLNFYLKHSNNVYNGQIFATADSENGIYGIVNKYTNFTAYTYKYPMFIYPDNNNTQLDNCLNNQKASKRQVISYLAGNNL